MLELQSLRGEHRQWSPQFAGSDRATGAAVSPLLIASGSWSKLRAGATRLAREASVPLVVVKLSALCGDCWRGSDREINRLFSHPANRKATVVIRGADPLLAAAEDPRFHYLLQRIHAHRGTVILAVDGEPDSLVGLDIEIVDLH